MKFIFSKAAHWKPNFDKNELLYRYFSRTLTAKAGCEPEISNLGH